MSDFQSFLAKLKSGADEATLQELDRWLQAHARRALPRKDRVLRRRFDSADLRQEALVRILREAVHFRGESAAEFRSFAASVLRQEFIRRLREVRAQRRDIRREESGDGVPAPWTLETPSREIDRRERKAAVHALLATLEPIDQTIVEARLQGADHKAIAERVGLSAAAVRQRYSRALKTLEQRWHER